MQKYMIVLFNLKPGVKAEDYEHFAAQEDMPMVKRLPSVQDMKVNRVVGTLDGSKPPYQYMELISIADFDQLGKDAQNEEIQKVAAKFLTFADKPVFLLEEQFA